MATRNQLHELLKEDQEPFRLRDFIADRRQRLHHERAESSSTCLVGRRPSSSFTAKLCKSACFFSGGDSPEVTQTPGINKSPRNVILLHVPARTAAMLLEGSARIRKPEKLDPKRLGTLGSFLKKLKHSSDGVKRNKSEVGVPVRDILEWDSSTTFIEHSVTRIRENPTFSPAIISGCSHDFETEFLTSPFRFVLHNASTSHRPLDSSSPPDSPCRADTQSEFECIGSDEKDSTDKCENAEEEEHCSPVSVLDPDPYEEEDNIEDRHEEEEESSSCDMDRSYYANIQRAQQKLLEKLSRFERLAGFDPLELEMSLQGDDEEEDFSDVFVSADEEGEENCNEIESSSDERGLCYIDQLRKEILERPEIKMVNRVPAELSKVIRVVLEEEQKLVVFDDKNVLLERVVRRLAPWKEMIYAMGGLDTSEELGQATDAVMDIELAIFGALVEEMCKELLHTREEGTYITLT